VTEPLVVAEDLRIDVDGVPACDGLAFRTRGDRVIVLGAPRALFEALAGLRPVIRGALRVRGSAVSAVVQDRVVAGAPLDPPLPPKWTALEYVIWSARLAGHTANDARALAKEAIARVQLGALAAQPLVRVPSHARRGVVIAAALATDAQVMVVEDPLANLAEEVARTWARILVQALEERPWVVLAGRVSLTSPLAMNAEEALIVSGSRLDAQGPPAEIAAADHRFVARIHGPLDALLEKLTARGARMDVQGAQVLLDLGESVTTADLLGMAAEADVTIVEMVPVARALT
jgi:ABC-2 type transport system ATP-binding protein